MNETVDTFEEILGSFVEAVSTESTVGEDPEEWATLQPEYMTALVEGQIVALKAAIASKQGTAEIRQHAVEAAAQLMRLAYIYGDL